MFYALCLLRENYPHAKIKPICLYEGNRSSIVKITPTWNVLWTFSRNFPPCENNHVYSIDKDFIFASFPVLQNIANYAYSKEVVNQILILSFTNSQPSEHLSFFLSLLYQAHFPSIFCKTSQIKKLYTRSMSANFYSELFYKILSRKHLRLVLLICMPPEWNSGASIFCPVCDPVA